jgi:hypothetical protein
MKFFSTTFTLALLLSTSMAMAQDFAGNASSHYKKWLEANNALAKIGGLIEKGQLYNYNHYLTAQLDTHISRIEKCEDKMRYESTGFRRCAQIAVALSSTRHEWIVNSCRLQVVEPILKAAEQAVSIATRNLVLARPIVKDPGSTSAYKDALEKVLAYRETIILEKEKFSAQGRFNEDNYWLDAPAASVYLLALNVAVSNGSVDLEFGDIKSVNVPRIDAASIQKKIDACPRAVAKGEYIHSRSGTDTKLAKTSHSDSQEAAQVRASE